MVNNSPTSTTSSTLTVMKARGIPVALYLPNLLGYARVVSAFVGLRCATGGGSEGSRPGLAILVWTFSAALDLFDGILARRLDQCSNFGANLDVVADNVLRSATWLAAATGPGYKALASTEAASCVWVPLAAGIFIALEWTTFVLTQLRSATEGGAGWKKQQERSPVWLISALFRNNFRNPIGVWAIYGLFSAGALTYASETDLRWTVPGFDMFWALAISGRLLSAIVEVWTCCNCMSQVADGLERMEGNGEWGIRGGGSSDRREH